MNASLDEAFFCHVGFTVDDWPCVVPTVPAQLTALPPQPDLRVTPGVALPAAVAAWSRGARR